MSNQKTLGFVSIGPRLFSHGQIERALEILGKYFPVSIGPRLFRHGQKEKPVNPAVREWLFQLGHAFSDMDSRVL